MGGARPLIELLREPACYAHAAAPVEVVETHISWVLLAGDYAYKVKKPVRLPFLDFSSLEARRRYCEEELRLNRRTAPELYLEVVPVVRTAQGAAFGGRGEAIEYAVKMRRFAPDALAEQLARRGALDAPKIDAIAAAVASFHAAAPRAGATGDFGTPAQVAAPALGNFDQIAALRTDAPAALARLRAWTQAECARLAARFAERRAGGWVRECHGDLHLGNIAFLGARAVPFDCIEFDPALRWIDVASEIAFLVMDLRAHGLDGAAWRLLNDWLQASGDYACIDVLRFYLVYRAMVRAKIACLRGSAQDYRAYFELAESLAAERRPLLVLMHGVSGSGKTTMSQALLERSGAVRLRSDVERKRLHGIEDPAARSGAGLNAGIYGAASSARTYERLATLSRSVLLAGYPVIVDAAFLRRDERDRFRRLARSLGAGFLIASCGADRDTLQRRVAERQARARDASEADAAVLALQLRTADPLAADEAGQALQIDTGSDAARRAGIEEFVARAAAMEHPLAAH